MVAELKHCRISAECKVTSPADLRQFDFQLGRSRKGGTIRLARILLLSMRVTEAAVEIMFRNSAYV